MNCADLKPFSIYSWIKLSIEEIFYQIARTRSQWFSIGKPMNYLNNKQHTNELNVWMGWSGERKIIIFQLLQLLHRTVFILTITNTWKVWIIIFFYGCVEHSHSNEISLVFWSLKKVSKTSPLKVDWTRK